MGGTQSTESVRRRASPEELSNMLADRFASKYFSPLELIHLKDNFYSRALNERGLRYWNEEILSHFLGIPDGIGTGASTEEEVTLDAGPVIFRMVSYLGAFPFQSTMAPSVLTFEAMIKVVVLLTERYGRVLKRGKKDRMKLLFGSLADFRRKDVIVNVQADDVQLNPLKGHGHGAENATFHAAGFAIDEPANDDEDGDDDDLALAALESLDAIEVFKHDQRIDRTVYESRISADTFRRLLMLLLVIAPLRPQDVVSDYTTHLSPALLEALQATVDSITSAFGSKELKNGIGYGSFSRIIAGSLPYLFDPLSPLFEHFLFSKNLDLSRRSNPPSTVLEKPTPLPGSLPLDLSPAMLRGSFKSAILTPALLSHLSFFLATSTPIPNLFHNQTRLHPVFSSAFHGESLTYFSHHVMTWQAPTILLLQGVANSLSSQEELVTVGAYLPQPWKSPSPAPSRRGSAITDPSTLPCLFQLAPTHTVLQGAQPLRSIGSNMPVASFSTKTGIALGCLVPQSSRVSHIGDLRPVPAGGGSLIIDTTLENAKFITSDGLNGEGVFLPPVVASPSSSPMSTSAMATTISISIYNLEVWGLISSPSTSSGIDIKASSTPPDAIALQQSEWKFEAREAERRRSIYTKAGGSDSDTQSGRALLEMAGLIGDSWRSGSSH